jgi:hypothetical protein
MSTIDVERLARALNATVGTNGWLRSTPSDPVEEWRVNARLIAAEYDRLAESRPSDGLAAAAEEYLVAVGAYLDPSNQFTDSRRHHVEIAEAALRAALAEADSAAAQDPE